MDGVCNAQKSFSAPSKPDPRYNNVVTEGLV
jgi:hypothetical protein